MGNTNVGKSSILNRYVKDEFKEEFWTTIGIDFLKKSEFIDDKEVVLQVWDQVGGERFRSTIYF